MQDVVLILASEGISNTDVDIYNYSGSTDVDPEFRSILRSETKFRSVQHLLSERLRLSDSKC